MLTKAQSEALLAELKKAEYGALGRDEAFKLLHEAPASQKTGPAPLDADAIIDALTDCAALAANPLSALLFSALHAQDHARAATWTKLLEKGVVLPKADAETIRAALTATVTTDGVSGVPRIATVFQAVAGMPNAIEASDFTMVFNAMKGGA